MGPERNNFLRRNRIIAGMADATLVVESAETGGALITSRMASSYQRDVLAVPGRATDERSRGCNNLIKKSVAALVESAEDIIEHLNWTEDVLPGQMHLLDKQCITTDERVLLELMTNHPGIVPGELSRLSGIPIQGVLSLLTAMELKRWVYVEPGNQYQAKIRLP
jgi:DNA processing protein